MPARSVLLALVFVSASGCEAGCAEPSPQLGWRFTFARTELATRLHFVEAEVLVGGCGGLPVFATHVTRDGAGATPGQLEPGRYGFRGRAQDGACLWFAEGCHEAILPRGGAVDVVLSESASPLRDPGCTPVPSGPNELPALDATPQDMPGPDGSEQVPADIGFDVTPSPDAGATQGEPSPTDAGTPPRTEPTRSIDLSDPVDSRRVFVDNDARYVPAPTAPARTLGPGCLRNALHSSKRARNERLLCAPKTPRRLPLRRGASNCHVSLGLPQRTHGFFARVIAPA